jgi:hypothetical protein
MGELLTLATQAGIFFLFTPFCLIARYGGRAIDLHRAEAERRATMRAHGIDHVEWITAGQMTRDDLGELRHPALPPSPGLRRLEYLGPYPGLRHIHITGSVNLHALATDRRAGRQFADDDMTAHLKLGGVINVSYIDIIESRDGLFDLADRTQRVQAVDFMRQGAEIELARAA